MKKFITRLSLISSFILVGILFFFSLADGYTDAFYLRFTTPRKENIILGTSRAAQGLIPFAFKEVLGLDLFNYAFTIGHSPYGPVYFESIKKKLEPSKQAVFIVCIDPWSISSITDDPNNYAEFRENKLCLSTTNFVNMNPNYEYLFKNYSGRYFELLLKNRSGILLHKSGWLEVSVDMSSEKVKERVESKIKEYQSDLYRYKFSSLRLSYLKKIVEYLKNNGKVYLVRLPISSEIMKIECELMSDFDSKIQHVIEISDGYLDMTSMNDQYLYTDGNHLEKESSYQASKYIANWIKSDE